MSAKFVTGRDYILAQTGWKFSELLFAKLGRIHHLHALKRTQIQQVTVAGNQTISTDRNGKLQKLDVFGIAATRFDERHISTQTGFRQKICYPLHAYCQGHILVSMTRCFLSTIQDVIQYFWSQTVALRFFAHFIHQH